MGEAKWAVPGLNPALSERSGRGLAVRKEGADRQETQREIERAGACVTEGERERGRERGVDR